MTDPGLRIGPSLTDATAEYVLVQAWKKTASYIRYHNWFADTLELDAATANLPEFLKKLAGDILSGDWQSDPLRLVPAPKSQNWGIVRERWRPTGGNKAVKLRPLAHVSLRDQIAATAAMLCLADKVETAQGDPRKSVERIDSSKDVVSYGNRLFCDSTDDGLVHRWASSKLYRAYFQDYKAFLSRPEVIADRLSETNQIAIVQSDLTQFYDRVSPQLLQRKLAAMAGDGVESAFFEFVTRVFNWGWHRADQGDARDYARVSGLEDFDQVALPQGLVASGFFANAVLLDFDDLIRNSVGQQIVEGAVLIDGCRYVDDLRLVLNIDGPNTDEIQAGVIEWLRESLTATAPGLTPSSSKTQLALFRGETRPLLRQSRKMSRIQTAVSGGFDAEGGIEIIEAVQGLVRAQERFSTKTQASDATAFRPVPDVRDETVSRFAAVRFRNTFRSLRPLLEDEPLPQPANPEGTDDVDPFIRREITRAELDDEVRAFALTLIENWIHDPSNVRLLRIGLDLWPSPDVVSDVIQFLKPYLAGSGRGRARKVALYCIADIYRAGATETGFVSDTECLPDGVDIDGFRQVLAETAKELLESASSLPWYVNQQLLLFLAIYDAKGAPVRRRGTKPETRLYRDLICFLRGESANLASPYFATLAVIARRSILDARSAATLIGDAVVGRRFSQIALRDPLFADELRRTQPGPFSIETDLARDLGLIPTPAPEGWVTLADLVLRETQPHSLRNEIGVLSFAVAFAEYAAVKVVPEVVSPSAMRVRLRTVRGFQEVAEIDVVSAPNDSERVSLYKTPSWCSPDEKWRFQLGYLLRFILTAQVDFTGISRESWRDLNTMYRPLRSHWFQRIYGFYNAHDAFGDDWLPISAQVENLLFSLLAWPGCRRRSDFSWVYQRVDRVVEILREMLSRSVGDVGEATGVLFLRVPAPIPAPRKNRPLRACVIQTVTPQPSEFTPTDLTFDDPSMRHRHRNHLSTALAAVVKMLALRETHKRQDNRLDWLILPELAVHPADVQTHLVPFARAYRTIILAGLCYEPVLPGGPLVNSALWIIPQSTEDQGLQVIVRRQGKFHLAPNELELVQSGAPIESFRPAQWLVGYEWASSATEPLWLTASICYDATDIKLASDLRQRSDVFAIPALNQDVGTFDQMAMALHYHMYQLVVVANNGCFGGSNAHLPKKQPYVRQVFHMHGQPQATISFFEIDEIAEMKQRLNIAKPTHDEWKYPPAGL